MDLDADRLAAAKLWLITDPGDNRTGAETADLPYLAHALYALVPVASSEVQTASVDQYWRLYINPAWLAAADIASTAAEMLHGLWHLLADHASRAGDLQVTRSLAEFWKIGADVSIQHAVNDVRLTRDLPTARDHGVPVGLSAEEYFALLSGLPVNPECGADESDDEPLPSCGSGCDGLRRPHELPPASDSHFIDEHEAAQIRRHVAVAYREHCATRGTDPGQLGRWAADILDPQIAWEPLLAQAVRHAVGWAAGHTHYTYRKRSRRQSAAPNILLPGTRRPLPNVAMIIDTSGSVDDLLLGRALGEVDGALRGLGVPGESVTVLACDAAVQSVTKVRRARDAHLAGGGGTDLRAGLVASERLRPRPDLVVVLTDGYTPWPEAPPPGVAVIAGILGRAGDLLPPTPVWAKRIECVVA